MNVSQVEARFKAADPARSFTDSDLASFLPGPAFPPVDPSARPSRKRRRRPTRRVLLVAAALLLALLLVAAAWVRISRRSTSTPLSASCYETLATDTGTTYVVGVDPGQSPEQACAAHWKQLFRSPAPPSLVACVIGPRRITGVFPDVDGLGVAEICDQVGGAVPKWSTASYGGLTADEVRYLEADIQHRWDSLQVDQCAGVDDLTAQINQALAAAGATDWSIDDRTSTTMHWTFADGKHAIVTVPTAPSGQTCAEFSIDPKHAVVRVINSWPHMPLEPTP